VVSNKTDSLPELCHLRFELRSGKQWRFSAHAEVPMSKSRYLHAPGEWQYFILLTAMQSNWTSCICPKDKTGSDCTAMRPLACSLTLASPLPDCNNGVYEDTSDPKFNLLDTDKFELAARQLNIFRSCFSYSLSDEVLFNYDLICAFNPPKNFSDKVLNGNFSYYIDNDRVR
jgi:hypothetical protein